MNKNIKYINEVQLNDINWRNLLATYNTGEEVEKLLKSDEFTDIKNFKKYSRKLYDIEKEIEHQSTLWPVTPFALIFLGRNLQKVEKFLTENIHTSDYQTYKAAAERSLEIFALITELLKEEYFEHFENKFPDEIKIYDSIEEVVNNKEIQELSKIEFEDEEKYIEELCELVASDDILFDSIIHYTDMVIREFVPVIEKLAKSNDKNIEDIAKDILEYLGN